MSADSITVSSAELGWTENGTAANWDVEFGLEGFTATGAPTFSTEMNPYLQSGLETNTCYDFYVRANCGADDTSVWVGPYNFCTLNDIGVNEGEIDSIIKMYPNPTDGILKIDAQQNVSVLLFDLLGKQLLNTSLTTGLNTIDIASFDTGVYFVRIAIENKTVQANKTYRIIKK